MIKIKKYEYTTRSCDKVEVVCVFIILFIILYFLALKDASFEYLNMLPSVNVEIVPISLPTVVLIIVMLVAVVTGVLKHEFWHYVGYKLSAAEPKVKHRGFNLYITNLEQSINLRKKLCIDALPTIIGIALILIFVLINQFYTIPGILNYFIATVLISSVAPARMDWRNIHELYNMVENTKEYTIKHREEAQDGYPIGIIERK